MKLRGRLRHVERTARQRGYFDCPVCRNRKGSAVLVTARQLPDGTWDADEPEPCAACGAVPELMIAFAEVVVASRDDIGTETTTKGSGTGLVPQRSQAPPQPPLLVPVRDGGDRLSALPAESILSKEGADT
jgi:hypothetical protein